MNAYGQRLRALLSARERAMFARLSSPRKIQDFLDRLPINLEETGETILSPRRVLREKRAHCFEAALLAAACFAYHDRPALLLDFQASPADDDHVVALFRRDGLWGAISKTNHAVLRWRDPVYRTVRELAMSYFHEYFVGNGKKTLRAVSKPFDVRRYAPRRWVTAEDDLVWLEQALDDSPHVRLVPRRMIALLRTASPLEQRASNLVEWKARRSAA